METISLKFLLIPFILYNFHFIRLMMSSLCSETMSLHKEKKGNPQQNVNQSGYDFCFRNITSLLILSIRPANFSVAWVFFFLFNEHPV